MELYLGGEIIKAKNEEWLKDTVKFCVFEEDVTSSDLVGETAEIPVKALIDGDKKTLKSHQIDYQNKKAGQL